MTMKKHSYGYKYFDAEHTYAHAYLLPTVEKILSDFKFNKIKSLMDVGCGNGSLGQFFSTRGIKVVGIDSS